MKEGRRLSCAAGWYGSMDDAVAWEVNGPAGAPAIVLVHGLTGNRKMWRLHAPLMAREHRVIAVDLPGHGALAGEPFRLGSAARLLGEVVRAEGGGRALVVGDSLGGYCAMAFAAANPGMASGLVLASCSLDLRGPVGMAALAGAALLDRVLLRPLPHRAMLRAAETECRRITPSSVAEAMIAEGIRVAARPEAFRALAGRDFPAMVRRYPGPVLFLNGRWDRSFRRHEGLFLRAARDGRLRHLEGVGHVGSLEKPVAFGAAVLEFAAAIEW